MKLRRWWWIGRCRRRRRRRHHLHPHLHLRVQYLLPSHLETCRAGRTGSRKNRTGSLSMTSRLAHGNDSPVTTERGRCLNIQGKPHPLQPGKLIAQGGPGGPGGSIPPGPGGDPPAGGGRGFQDIGAVFSSGSGVDCVCVGWGLGVTVTTTGGKVVPPVVVVLAPRVSVIGGSDLTCEPQVTSVPGLVVVAVGLTIEVVPLRTLQR